MRMRIWTQVVTRVAPVGRTPVSGHHKQGGKDGAEKAGWFDGAIFHGTVRRKCKAVESGMDGLGLLSLRDCFGRQQGSAYVA